ncbi:MAG: amidohydrolase family protein, partial [candidate division Zixibacteria bacterium]|nr:amidohydrolase family protein [candidate division Zixibacteria bacterium]
MRPDGPDTIGGAAGVAGLAVVRNGRIVDPASGRDEQYDLWMRDGRIIDRPTDDEAKGAAVIDAAGLLVLPGLVDLHAHLCEPGFEYRETLESGALAAAAGGVTSVACMPDTDPVIDDAPTVEFVRERAAGAAAKIHPIAAVTVGRRGERLTEAGELAEAGAVALSDAGRSIRNPAILRRALEYGRMFDLPILVHCEDPSLSAGGHMHEGSHATRLGLKGIPSIAEEIVSARDLMLAEWTGGRIHVTHASTAATVDLIRSAKQRGVRVTAD